MLYTRYFHVTDRQDCFLLDVKTEILDKTFQLMHLRQGIFSLGKSETCLSVEIIYNYKLVSVEI